MTNVTSTEIERLITRFEARTLPKAEWTHEAHLVAAIWYVHNEGTEKAMNLLRDFISKYNASLGNQNTETEGYHESITKFWLLVAERFLNKNQFLRVEEACNAFVNSVFDSNNYPLEFYSKEVLFSVEARMNWVEPDRKEI